MRRLLLAGILALAFTCAVSLTVSSEYDRVSPSSLSEQLLQSDHNKLDNPFG